MSDTPTTDRLELSCDELCVPGGSDKSGMIEAQFARKMERLLRHLRANANCYVPPPVLQEVDDFLNQK